MADPAVIVALLLALLTSLVSVVRIYGSDTAGLLSRITALEARQLDEDRRMERIENKIDVLLQRATP